MTIIIPKDNNKDLEEIPSNIMKDMKFILAKEMDDVVKNALLFDKEKKQRIKGKPRRSKSK